jgi:hypothetical protein
MTRMTLLLFVALVLPACTTFDVKTEYDSTADFSRYKTFVFADPADIGEERTPDEVALRDRIEPAISEELKDKGYQFLQPGQQAILRSTIGSISKPRGERPGVPAIPGQRGTAVV